MAVVEINRNPTRRDLLVFSALLPILLGVLGALRWHAQSPAVAKALWIASVAVLLLVTALPASRRWLYAGWMYAVYPVAWAVSHLLLGVAFFVVATPVAMILRALGRDPMDRAIDKSARSYWTIREPKPGTTRYFRQF